MVCQKPMKPFICLKILALNSFAKNMVFDTPYKITYFRNSPYKFLYNLMYNLYIPCN